VTPAHPPEAGLYLGQTLQDYRVDAYLAEGGFGLVFAGTELATSRSVALKVLSQTAPPEQQLEFATEADLLYHLKKSSGVVDYIAHGAEPVIVTVPGTGAQVPLMARFIVLELATGCLEELLINRHHLAWSERLQLFRGAVLGVHQMHLAGMVHRDLKASNCLLFVEGQSRTTCKVSDLGRSRDLSRPPRFTAAEYLHGRGDLRFAPPELLWLQGKDDPQKWRCADLYGLGSILFEVATGQGITGVALGSGPARVGALLRMTPAERAADFAGRREELRGRYEIAIEIFRAELPPVLRQPATALLRQLCDPDPADRLPRIAPGRRRSPGGGLEWLLNRVSILSKTLYKAELQAARLAKRKRQTYATGR
jgi:serine/threonine protein kinase